MVAEMAARAKRDRLEARVQQLEHEVIQLRAALANVLEAAATGLHTHHDTANGHGAATQP